MKFLSVLVTGLVVGATTSTTATTHQVLNAFGEPSYGVDVSFPVHYLTFANDQPLGNRRKLYEDFLDGCREYYPDAPDSCNLTEEDRVAMSVRQPASMQVRKEMERWMALYCMNCGAYLTTPDPSNSSRITPIRGSKKSKHQKPYLIYLPTIGHRTMMNEPRNSGPAETHTSIIGQHPHTWSTSKKRHCVAVGMISSVRYGMESSQSLKSGREWN